MPHHHTQHVRNVGPNLFMCNESSAYVMPRVTAHAVAALCIHGMPGITYGAIHASQMVFIKINHLTF